MGGQIPPKGGRPGKRLPSTTEEEEVEEVQPTPSRSKPPAPAPKLAKVAKVQARAPPLDVVALARTVAAEVRDACSTLVEQVAVTGVEAALSKRGQQDIRPLL